MKVGQFRGIRTVGLLAALWVGLAPLGADAGTQKGTLEVEPHYGLMGWDGLLNQKNPSHMVGGRLGYLLQDTLAAEVGVHWSPAEIEDTSSRINWTLYHFDLLYHFRVNDQFAPFIGGGLGGAVTGGSDVTRGGFMLQYGLGFKYFFVDQFGFRMDGRHIAVFDLNDENPSAAEISVGLILRFWDEPAPRPRKAYPPPIVPGAPVVQPACDKVPDCAEPLDEKGCPLDSDHDGVVDGCDQCPDSPEGMEVDRFGCPLRGRILRLGVVHFDFDKSNLKPEAKKTLDGIIKKLKTEPDLLVSIEGHTDAVGTDAYNQALSERRAASVLRYLIAGGISKDRMTTQGYSEKQPTDTNKTGKGRANNRRAEIEGKDKKGGE